jgi:hypothetical protein
MIKYTASTGIWKFVRLFHMIVHEHELVWFAIWYPNSSKNAISLTHSIPSSSMYKNNEV